MSESERDLVAALRAELAGIDPARGCDREAEQAGLENPGRRDDPVIGRLLVRLARAGEGTGARSGGAARLPTDAAGVATGSGHAGHADHAGRATAGADPARATADLATDATAWADLPEHCRLAWLRGRFLGHGSLSLAAGRTHLEFVVSAREAPVLATRLGEMDLPASWRVRRGRGVVTWKSAETVTTFLGRIGAGPGLLELEARQVARTLRGELNRVLNAESANVARSVSAAGRQIAAIDELAGDGRLGEQPYVVRLVAEARRETPEATITEIAERLGVHRSAVQRALERLERLVLHAEDRSRRRRREPSLARRTGGELTRRDPTRREPPGRGPRPREVVSPLA